MTGHTDNRVHIEAPLDLVWDLTNDVESWPSLFSEYAAAEILQVRGDTIRFRLTLHPDENGVSWSWVSDRTPDEERHVVHAHRVETGPFQYMSLYWEYVPDETGTTLRWVQDFELKPTAPIDDAAMTRRLNTNSREQQALIKSRVEAAAASVLVDAVP